MNMAERIKEKRIEAGLTQEELAEKLGLKKSAIAKYENGRVENIKRSVIQKMSDILGCTPSYLMGWDENVSKEKVELGLYRIPIVAVVAAGIPIYSEDNIIGWVDYDRNPNNDIFALRIKGDSMSPKISDGDLIIVDKSAGWEDNDIVVVRINGHEGTCKRIKKYA